MKKLLSLLSVLTISGNGISSIIANSQMPIKDEKIIENNKPQFSSSQNNNLENLNINKQELSLHDYLEFNRGIIEKVSVLPEIEENKK